MSIASSILSLFRGGKKKKKEEQKPQTGIRRASESSQDALGWKRLFDNGGGIILADNGMYSMTLQFDDASFQASPKDAQDYIYVQWSNLLNSVSTTANVRAKVQIVSRAVPENQAMDQMSMPLVPGDERGNELRRDINRIIKDQLASSSLAVVRQRYLTLSVKAESRAKAQPVLARMMLTCRKYLRAIGVESHVLDGDELLDAMDLILNPYNHREGISMSELEAQPELHCIDLVAPPDFSRDPSRASCSWGDAFGQGIYVKDWASTTRSDCIASLAELPINQVITLDMRPWDQDVALDTITTMLNDLNIQKAEYRAKHPDTAWDDDLLPSSLRDGIKVLQGYLDDLRERDQRLWDTRLNMLTWGESAEQVATNFGLMKDSVGRLSMRLERMKNSQGQAFAASLPTATDDCQYVRTMTTAPAACLVPFTSAELMDTSPTSMYLGYNQISRNPICVDRLSMNGSNGFILGSTGGGKSVNAKTQIVWAWLTDPTCNVVVVDPEHEYTALARKLGMAIVKIGGADASHVNPFDLVLSSDDPGSDVAAKIDAIISEVEMMAKTLTELQRSLVDRCASNIYQAFLNSHDPADIPTLQDLYNELASCPEQEGKNLAAAIYRYVEGSANQFNHVTDVNTSARGIVYDLSETPENLKSLALFILLGETWNLTLRNRFAGRRTWIFIDEMQLLLSNDTAIEYLDNYYTRARKYGAIPTCMTQNVERVLTHERTRYMLANSDFLVILNQSATDARELARITDLSDTQEDFIRTAQPGEGLLIYKKTTIITFDSTIPDTSELYRIVTTKPGEELDTRTSLAV